MINSESKVKLNLSVQKKNKSYIVGSTSNNTFIEVPKEAVTVIEYCDGNSTVNEIKTNILKNENIDIDVLDFLQTLEELNLIYSIDDYKYEKDQKKEYPISIIKLSKILFNKYTAILYSILFLINSILIIFNRKLWPISDDAFFIEDRIGINMLIFFLISWGITFIHELGHFLSVVRLNINVKFSLNLRLIWLVIEADINGLWSVEREKRYFSYLAGICFETIIMFISIIIKLNSINAMWNRITSMVILILLLNFLWQFMIFLRTDLYLVLLTYFDMSSLYDYSKIYIKNRLSRSEENEQLKGLSSSEINYIKIFSLTYIGGVIFCGIRLFYEIPITLNIIYSSLVQVINGSLIIKIDGILVIVVMAVSALLWIKGAINKRELKKEE